MTWMLCAALCSCWTHPVAAKPRNPPNVLQMARESDAVLVGQVVKIGTQTARIAVAEVLKGAPLASVIEVTPVQRVDHVVGVPTVEPEQQVLLFLQRADVWRIRENGWGMLTVRPETKAKMVEGVKLLLALAGRGQDAIDRAMLAWATSDNPLLRAESHRHIALNLSHAKHSQNYKAQFLVLLQHPDADVRAVALQGLRFVRAEEALPLLINASRDAHLRVVQEASMALGQYDTTESVAALIALTQHPNADVRVRALIDLDDSRRPEAKTALVALLNDPDPKVRALAPRGLVMWLRRGQATEVIPKLLQMLDDPVAEVQVTAARELGEARDASALEPLLGVLERPHLSDELEKAAVGALAMIYERVEAPSRRPVDDKLNLIIAVLERGRWVASLSAVGLLAHNKSPQGVAALRRVAQTHPLEDIRAYAARLLAQ